ncbi:MAG: hypothetical protein KFB96_19505 [Thiocapsa sp.]|uniref:DapH/DapD/GlmU-related protein n=1 Tax=Thiocapsa sp. TaxID=2024551 RepID=UPI001BCDD7B4|nr:DapH/DapD/GlmU-related protein [Thiocapsa sp.]QVL47837.1 MAG: hypothetical protein KFB96_19505 [Thiocapsa sp.]
MRAIALPEAMMQLGLGRKLVILVYLSAYLLVLGVGLSAALWVFMALKPDDPARILPLSWAIIAAIITFCYGYLITLLVLRLIVPKSRPGVYRLTGTGRPPKQIVVFAMNNLLLRLRLTAPFATSLFPVLIKLPPLSWLYGRLFGPDSAVSYILDPYLVTIGKNTQLGFGTLVLAHFYDNRGLMLKPVRIGDRVVIGADSIICPGAEIGNGSVLQIRSVVYPDTLIPPNEYWGGNPAQKIKDLMPPVKPEKDTRTNPR